MRACDACEKPCPEPVRVIHEDHEEQLCEDCYLKMKDERDSAQRTDQEKSE